MPLLRDYGVQAIETSEPLTAAQLEALSSQFPGNKLERRGNKVTVAPCDPISGVTSAEVARQLGNWSVASNTHVVGGSDTGVRLDTFERVKVRPNEQSNLNTRCRSLSKADSLLVPDAWLMSQVDYTVVKKRGTPELKGCENALLVEAVPEATDLNPSGTAAKSVSDKADDWMCAGAAFLFIVNPYSEEFYAYDALTWTEGKWEMARRLDSIESLSPRPDLFPGLEIHFPTLLRRIIMAKTESF